MPINIRRQQDELHTITVEYGGESAEVAYYPRRLTPSLVRSMKDQEGIDSVISVLVRFVESWDIVDEDGNRLPPTAEVMAEFPLDFLKLIVDRTLEKVVPGEGTGATS